MVGQWNAQPLPPPPTPRSCRTTRFLSGYLIPASSALWTEDVDGRGKKERREGRIEGEVKRKVKGIERLRLEQVPLSGNGLARCHDQTRVCTASTVLAEEQPGKLNFGWNGREGGGGKSRREFTRESTREKGCYEHRCREKGERLRKMEGRDVRFLAIHPFNRREECENKGSVLSSAAKRIWSGNTVGKGREREKERIRFGWNPRPYISTAYSSNEIRRIRHKATA